ncbi:hypothetical protein EME01_59340 [Sinorhizobium meliloti]|nr:hypothetical protein EME01_59340 [Sinorhizobium meliloti]
MRPVRAAIVQADLGIAGKIEGPLSSAMVDDGKLTHFRVGILRDADFPGDFNVFGTTGELGPVSVKRVRVAVCRLENGLLADRPHRFVRLVADVANLPPAISRDIFAPPRDVKAPPDGTTRACISNHDAVTAVGKQGDGWACIRQLRRAVVSRHLGRSAALICF